jgi:hypothetical protein
MPESAKPQFLCEGAGRPVYRDWPNPKRRDPFTLPARSPKAGAPITSGVPHALLSAVEQRPEKQLPLLSACGTFKTACLRTVHREDH